jgi:uncharacterized protein (TIGR00255 family)
MNPRSMTGYARVRQVDNDREIVVTLKSVNHRGLDVHFRMPPELDPFEGVLRGAVKQCVARGHLQLSVRVVSARAAAPALVNRALLETYIETYRRMAAVHGLHSEPDLNAALRLPGMFEPLEQEPDPDLGARLIEVLGQALRVLNEFREREGAEIAFDMRRRNMLVLQAAKDIEKIRTRATAHFQARLADRLGELLQGVLPDPQRLAQEAAFLVERSDISEELTRLKVHAVQLEDLLAGGGEIGKKIDFLLQEMQRETNTILSKSTGVGEPGLEITEMALGAKAEIEKIREQGLNLE